MYRLYPRNGAEPWLKCGNFAAIGPAYRLVVDPNLPGAYKRRMEHGEFIAVVDDEVSITDSVAFALRKAGLQPLVFHDGESALEEFRARLPGLIILDIMMPGMDGLELCRTLRGEKLSVPIIFLSSRDEELDRLLGFEMGGDDYLTKPFSIRELLARVKAILRRSDGTAARAGTAGLAGSADSAGMADPAGELHSQMLMVGGAEVDGTAALCSFRGETVPLTLTELRILSSLAADPGIIKSRGQLMSAAFPEDHYTNDRAADSHIKRLRKKLNLIGADGNAIETIYGMGYRISRSDRRGPS